MNKKISKNSNIFFQSMLIFFFILSIFPLTPLAINANPKKIIILPFQKLNKERNQDLDVLTTGVSESLMGSMAGVKNFIIVDPERVKRYLLNEIASDQKMGSQSDDKMERLRKLTEEKLSGDYIIYGSFQKIANQIRLTARLMNVSTGAIEKAASVHGVFPDRIFDLQDQLAQNLVKAINGEVRTEEKTVIASYNNSTGNFNAYQYYMRAREEHLRYSLENYPRAVQNYKKAIDIDSNYALAYAGLAEVYSIWAFQIQYSGGNLRHLAKEGIEFGKKAVQIAPNLFQSYRSLAVAYQNSLQFAEARKAIKKALALNSNDAESLYVHASLENYGHKEMGKPGTESNRAIKKALEINPDLIIALWSYAYSYYKIAKYDDALQLYLRIVELNPKHHSALLSIGLIYYNKKDCDNTIKYTALATQYGPQVPQAHYTLALGYFCKKDYAATIPHLQRAVALRPKYDKALYTLGSSYYNLKDYKNAAHYYGQTLKVNPNYTAAKTWKANAEAKLRGDQNTDNTYQNQGPAARQTEWGTRSNQQDGWN